MYPLVSASLLGGVLAVENRSSLGLMLSQPLCGGALTGLVLGAPSEGLLFGTLFQMMFLGFVFVRGERVPDFQLGGIAGSALFIMAGRMLGDDPGLSGAILIWSMCVALLVSWIGGHLYRVRENRLWSFSNAAAREAARGSIDRAGAVHIASVLVHFVGGFLVVFIAVLLGRPVVAFLAGRSSELWPGSQERYAVLIPFIGIGSLVRLHVFTARIFWFVAGFLVATVFLMIRG